MSNINLPNIINDSSRFKLIPATSLKNATTMSDPKFTMEEVKANIASWVEKQDSFWPEELTSDILTQYALLAFAPHWILDGRASGSWSANIGRDRTVHKTCSHCQGRGEWQGSDLEGKPRMFNCASCNGTGQTSDTVTDWHSQSGVATGHINGKVLENVANDTPIRCGKREFSAEESWLKEPFPDDILIFEPEAVGNETGLELAEKQLRKVLHDDGYDTASGLGQVRNFKLGYVNIESKEARTWLYPIYVSSYKYGEKEYLIEMDGITGKLHIEIPGTVRAKRILKWSAIIATIVVIGLIIYGISNIILPSTNEYISQLNATATPLLIMAAPSPVPLPTDTISPSPTPTAIPTSVPISIDTNSEDYTIQLIGDSHSNVSIKFLVGGEPRRDAPLWIGHLYENDSGEFACDGYVGSPYERSYDLDQNGQIALSLEPGLYGIFESSELVYMDNLGSYGVPVPMGNPNSHGAYDNKCHRNSQGTAVIFPVQENMRTVVDIHLSKIEISFTNQGSRMVVYLFDMDGNELATGRTNEEGAVTFFTGAGNYIIEPNSSLIYDPHFEIKVPADSTVREVFTIEAP